MTEPPYYLRLTDAEGRNVHVRALGPTVLGPGRYQVGLRLSQVHHDEVPWGEIEVPEEGFVDPGLNSGLAFTTTEPPPYGVYAENLDTGATVGLSGSWGPLALPPGRYRIDLRPDQQTDRFTIIEELAIAPGELIQVEM